MTRTFSSIASVLALAAAASAQVATYTFTQSTGTYTPITGGTVIATASTANTQDDATYAVTLPFTFPFNNTPTGPGTFETQVQVQTNGHLAFGTATATSYTPLSSTNVTDGYVSAMGGDLQGGYVCTATRTLGSDQVTAVNAMGPLAVGMVVTGTGIPTGTTITAIGVGSFTMSALATATSAGTAVTAYGASDIRWELQGVSPNQEFVVQWSNFKRFGSTLTTTSGLYLNFQIRLREDGRVQCVYGNCSPGVSTSTSILQAGLRGPTNVFSPNINSRQNVKNSSDWATSIASTTNAQGEVFNNVATANVIPNGLTYEWAPPVPSGCSGTPTPGNTVAPAAACAGASFSLSLQNSTPGTGITYQWYSSTTSATGPWSPMGTGTTQSASQVVDTWYYCDVTCTAGPATGSSAVAYVPMSVPTAVQDWETGTVTPNCWSVDTTSAYLPNLAAQSGYGVGTGSVRFYFYLASNGTFLNLTSPQFGGVAPGTEVYFDVAGQTYTGGEIDHIILQESNDGGTTWTDIVDMTNAPNGSGALNTAGAVAASFVPTAAQWTSLHYPLTPGTNRVRFHGISNFGNSCYIDNVSIGVPPSARNTVYGVGCNGYAMSAAPAPITGNTVIYTQTNIPEAAPSSGIYFGVVAFSLNKLFPGLPLNVATVGAIDSPCPLNIGSLDLMVTFVSGAPTDNSVTFGPVPAVIGVELYAQAFALITPVAPNNAGIATSNGVASFINLF